MASEVILAVVGGLTVGLLVWIAGALYEISHTLKDIRKDMRRKEEVGE